MAEYIEKSKTLFHHPLEYKRSIDTFQTLLRVISKNTEISDVLISKVDHTPDVFSVSFVLVGKSTEATHSLAQTLNEMVNTVNTQMIENNLFVTLEIIAMPEQLYSVLNEKNIRFQNLDSYNIPTN